VLWADFEGRHLSERAFGPPVAWHRASVSGYRNKLWHAWAFWRGVRFVSSRREWQDRYGRAAGGVPPSMQMPLATAMALLGVSADYSREDVIAAFRRAPKKAHRMPAARPRCFGPWSRRAIARSPRSAPAKRRRRCRATIRAVDARSTAGFCHRHSIASARRSLVAVRKTKTQFRNVVLPDGFSADKLCQALDHVATPARAKRAGGCGRAR
jgi:hypothetical protein